MTKREHGLNEEDGAILLFFAVGILALLLGISAVVVDLAALRQDRRADRLASDTAAAAGAASLDPFSGGAAEEACETAWDYVFQNLADENTTPPINCTMFASTCDHTTLARTTTGTAGPYTITITHPVPNDHHLMTTQAINPVADGVACQRLGVEIARDRQHTFASVIGFDTGSTLVASVARVGVGLNEPEFVPLLVLEPIACDALYTSGQGRVTVAYNLDAPGMIVVDSDASKTTNPNRCGNNIYTIEAQGIQPDSWIRALPVPGPDRIRAVISSYALSGQGAADPTHAYNPDNLTQPIDPSLVFDPPNEPPDTYFRLYPEPTPSGERVTRAPIDWEFNCKTHYDDYPLEIGNPSLGGIPIETCTAAPAKRSFIDDLRGFLPLLGSGLPPPGFATYWDDPGTPENECNLASSDPPVHLSGDYWVNCTGPQGLSINNSVTFSGGNVVFEGPVNVGAQGDLTINAGATPPPVPDHWVVVRRGVFKKDAQADLIMNSTFVFLEDEVDGAINFGGGSGTLIWTAPYGPANESMFDPGNYMNLALWTESTAQQRLAGQAGYLVEGTLFTPMALFTLTGQSTHFQTNAQFITRRLEVGGQGEVRMRPDPTRQTPIPRREIRLIR